jgi:hypothetical protein
MADGSESHQSNAHDLVQQVRSVGGDLVVVLNWPQYANVSKGAQLALAGIVGEHDDLNTLAAVDYLADAVTFHGQDLSVWWEEQLRNHDLECIILALNALRELGWRGEVQSGRLVEPTEIEDQLELEDLIEFIEQIAALGFDIVTVEALLHFIERCGGWDVARGLRDEQILEVRDDPKLAEKFLRAHLKDTEPMGKKGDGDDEGED